MCQRSSKLSLTTNMVIPLHLTMLKQQLFPDGGTVIWQVAINIRRVRLYLSSLKSEIILNLYVTEAMQV